MALKPHKHANCTGQPACFLLQRIPACHATQNLAYWCAGLRMWRHGMVRFDMFWHWKHIAATRVLASLAPLSGDFHQPSDFAASWSKPVKSCQTHKPIKFNLLIGKNVSYIVLWSAGKSTPSLPLSPQSPGTLAWWSTSTRASFFWVSQIFQWSSPSFWTDIGCPAVSESLPRQFLHQAVEGTGSASTPRHRRPTTSRWTLRPAGNTNCNDFSCTLDVLFRGHRDL